MLQKSENRNKIHVLHASNQATIHHYLDFNHLSVEIYTNKSFIWYAVREFKFVNIFLQLTITDK